MYAPAAAGVGVVSLGLFVPGGNVAFVVARALLITSGLLFLAYVLTVVLLVVMSNRRARWSAEPLGAGAPAAERGSSTGSR